MKSQLDSKTVWFNVIMLFLFIGSILDSTTLHLFGFSNDTISKITASVGLITAVGNYVLRVFFTSTALTKTAKDNK